MLMRIVIALTLFLSFFLNIEESIASEQKVKKKTVKVSSTDVVRAKFGSGPDDIGILTPKEGNCEGPMSFTISEKGEIYILDQVNSRIQCFKGGKRIKIIPIPSDTFMDIALTQDGKIILLDNAIKKSVYILDSEGKTLNIIPLEGRLIPYGPEVTEILYVKRGKFAGIWAILLEDRSVRIAMPEGTTVTERIGVPGRFLSDGRRLIRAEIIGDATVVIYRSKQDSLSQWEPEITLFFNMYIGNLMGIWDDKSGRIYLAAALEDNNKWFNTVLVLTPEGKELKRVNLFVQDMPHEIHRSVRVSPDGRIFQMALDKADVFIRRYEILE